ncbi:carboxylesterase/lipase family protein [Pseudoalteromonas mariniglutinosa]|uniref:carboxylesterase/lipase family protein n=1 Tax=Pseudoalteromonas mariniglutinosa TaxID=206042 RepID=UPI00384C9E98
MARHRLKLTIITSAIIIAVTFLAACSKQQANDIAEVTGGTVQGAQQGKIIAFKGIPFAAAPVAENRWRSPQPVTKWQGIKNTQEFAADCMQKPFASDAAPLGTTPSEDCLYLNVFRPAKQAKQPYPVVVWIHGGGFVNGGASPEVYSGDNFAKQGIVFVSFNYRLGRFGFFAHPALSKYENDALGNYAFMDQIAALQWVNNNISQFAGDPEQVTIMGESAGGASVHAMMQTPAAQGLFNKAVIMSAGGRNLFTQLPLQSHEKNTLSAQQIGLNFAELHAITGSDSHALQALRALTVDEVIDGLNLSSLHTINKQTPTYSGGPILDGTIISAKMDEHLQNGSFSHVPVMVGTTDHDLGFANYPSKAALFASFNEQEKQARLAYDPDNTTPLSLLNYQVGQDSLMQEPARYVAAQVNRVGQQAFIYRFGYVAQTEQAQGAAHATEIPYFFNTVSKKYGHITTEQDKQTAKIIHRYVANFIKLGTPNGPGLPTWGAYQADENNILLLNKDGSAEFVRDPLEARLNVIQALTKSKP